MKRVITIVLCAVIIVIAVAGVYGSTVKDKNEKATQVNTIAQSIDEIKEKYNLADEGERRQCAGDIFEYLGTPPEMAENAEKNIPQSTIDKFVNSSEYGGATSKK